MSQNLLDFYAALAQDAQQLRQFFGDPEAVMSRFALSRQEQEIILEGDAEALAQHLANPPPPGS